MDGIQNLIKSRFDGGKASFDECGIQAAQNTDALLGRAQSELNVFPFNTVHKRWLQLYADIRLLRAQNLLEKVSDEFDNTHPRDEKLLSDAIAELDYALIVAGGGDENRRSLIQDVLESLGYFIGNNSLLQSDDGERPLKRQRLNGDVEGKQLPSNLSPLPVMKTPVPRISRPSLTHFEDWVSKKGHPLVLEGILDYWPALQKWKSSEYWLRRTLGGRRLVPVEIGQSYHDEDWRQQIMPFRDFLDRYILAPDGDRDEVGYLAQHDLFGQIEALRKDFTIPDFCYCDVPNGGLNEDDKSEQPEPEIHKNVWFGGRTVSPLHHDPYHNVLCQVHGTKYIRLYSPEFTSKLYPKSKIERAPHVDEQSVTDQTTDSKDSELTSIRIIDQDTNPQEVPEQTIDMSNNSSVDIFAMELSPDEDWDEKWPGISEVLYHDCILHEGEALYIPKGWWHYVRGLSSSGISISFWW